MSCGQFCDHTTLRRFNSAPYSNLHKGFKCLEPSTGRIYISRDVFDEIVYPFAQLHPNAGALLRRELDLLLDVLKNLSCDFGSAQIYDQCLVNFDPTNVVSSSFGVVDATGEHSAQNGARTGSHDRHFMLPSSDTETTMAGA